MKAIPLTASKRAGTGKGVARKLRADGRVPAVLYGDKTDPQPLELVNREITTIMRKSSSEQILIDLMVADTGGDPQMALLRDIQHDPITGDILHVDFLHISPTKRITVTVPVHIVGTAIGVKDRGGILQYALRELEIESLPADIPEKIDVDVSELGVGDAIHVRDLELGNVTFVTAAERTIASVVPPTVMRDTTETAAAEGEEAAEGEAAAAEGEGGEAAAKEGAKESGGESKDSK